MSFHSDNGIVHYDIDECPYCCGMSVIGNVSFEPVVATLVGRRKLYDDFHAFINEPTATSKQKRGSHWDWRLERRVESTFPDYNWNVYKFLLTDQVFARAKPNSIQQFCEYKGWVGGSVTKNPRHDGHSVQCWEWDIAGTVK